MMQSVAHWELDNLALFGWMPLTASRAYDAVRIWLCLSDAQVYGP